MKKRRTMQTVADLQWRMKWSMVEDEPWKNTRLPLRMRVWLRDKKCHWCDEVLSYEDTTVEHLVRRADGGRNTMANCVAACGPCNWCRGTANTKKKVARLRKAWDNKKNAIAPQRPFPKEDA